MLQVPYVQMPFYFCPLQATVVYQESLNHAHNRTRMIDSWLCSGFSFYQVNNNNNNNNTPLYDAQYVLCGEGLS